MVEPVFFLGDRQDAKSIREQYPLDSNLLKMPSKKEDEHPFWTLVLYFNKNAIATGSIKEIDPETYEIFSIAVSKSLVEKGIGKNTVKFLLTKIKTLGGRKAIVNSPIGLLPFFTRCGFSSNDGEVSLEKGEPTIKLEKILVKPHRGRF